MKYTLESLQKEYNQGKPIKFLLFWGHTPSSDGTISKSCLSQWWKSDFQINSLTYCCMEQYMMAEKAQLFNDNDIFQEIMNCKEPKKIKDLGRAVKNFNESIWCKNVVI